MALAPLAASAATDSRSPQNPADNAKTEKLLAHVEKRASSTSFTALDDFGHAAIAQIDVDGLRRLQHVLNVYLNNGELERATFWNRHMASNATALGSDRYRKIAELNAMKIAYEQGDESQSAKMRHVMDNTSDWYVRLTAVRYYAVSRFDHHQVGDGLKLLSTVEAQIPESDADAQAAKAGVWEAIGLGLMSLHDVAGATDALSRYELEHSHAGWPRPDFATVYSLGNMAIFVGDAETGQRYFDVHDRLSQRADLKGVKALNALMCARLARIQDDMARLVTCLGGYETAAADPYIKQRAWPLLAMALARQGEPAKAEALLAQWERFDTSLPSSASSNMAINARAEIAFARGRYAEGMALLRQYTLLNAQNDARAFSDGINQVTQDMQQQLSQRRHQLTIEQANVRLQGAMIRAQTWIVGVTLFFFVCGAVFAIWLWSQARELRRARSRAEQANTAKTRFLANMSHEIRTPLNGVIAMADALGQRPLAAQDRELVQIIRTSGKTLEGLLSDILDSARIESGELKLEQAPFDLKTMLNDVVELWGARAEAKGVAIKLVCADGIDGKVMGDVVRLRQVLNNLVSNALKFTDSGSVTVEALQSEDDRIYFCVTDTGVGFDDKVRQRIFARFQQADESITRRFGGSGLGLNISQELIALMGGEMDCASIPEQGAKFWFEIQLARVKSDPVVHDMRDLMADHSVATSTGLGLKVLLADDHAANRKVVEVLLAPLDVEIVSVMDGAMAVSAFTVDHFDLVLMDMQMPVMDGLTATRRLREIERRDGRVHTPIVMLTANAMAEHIEASLAAGADAHLTKPLTVQSLMNSINSVLDVAA